MITNTRSALLLAVLLCASLPIHASDASDKQTKLNDGYYLLHKLADDEAQLPLLLDVKHAPPEIKKYADDISKMGKETEAKIEEFQEHHHALNYDRNPLPPMEQDVRDSIKGDKQHQLLFGTSDSEFVRALIVSQIEASTYATHLTKVLGDQESSPARAQALHHLSDKWAHLREQAYRILRNY